MMKRLGAACAGHLPPPALRPQSSTKAECPCLSASREMSRFRAAMLLLCTGPAWLPPL